MSDSEPAANGSGPLRGIRVVELVSMGPAPYAAMLLSDLGADVIRIDRPEAARRADPGLRNEILNRGRRSTAIDLKSAGGLRLVLDLVAHADAVLEPYRPGTAERLGIGPDVCLARNPALVYARMTGWGQDGPLAGHAGHDINFVAFAGALEHIGRAGQPPVPPLNLVGDMGGGGLYLAFGVVCALLESRASGRGQVIDAAMIDGIASFMTILYGWHAQGWYSQVRGTNTIDSGAPFFEVYACADERYVSVGPVEFRFWANLLRAIGLDPDELPRRNDPQNWDELKRRIAGVFRTRTRDEWCALLDRDTELCFAPVLGMLEAPRHPHHVARGTFTAPGGTVQPAPGPRFSRTPGAIQRPPALPGEHTDEVLASWLGLGSEEIRTLRAAGVVAGGDAAATRS